MSLARSIIKRYYKLRLSKSKWHIISTLPQLKIKRSLNGSQSIYYKGKWVAQTRPLPELKKLATEECFIIATGPSIKTTDLSLLKEQSLYGVNGSATLCKKHEINFSLYTVIDPSFVKYKIDLIKQVIDSGTRCLFNYKVIKAICDHDPKILQGGKIYLVEEMNQAYHSNQLPADKFYFHTQHHPYIYLHPDKRPKETRVGFSKDVELGIFDGGTVTYWALQVAYYIGFKRIYILGMDLGGDRFYDTKDIALPSYLDDDYEKYIKPAFETAKLALDNDENVEVFNLAMNSRLPDSIIQKKPYDEVIAALNPT